VGLVETWVEKQSWEKVEKTLPKEYKWEGQWAKRERKRGRAAGGIITGVKLGIEEKQKEKGEEEGYMERNVHIDNEWWKIATVYSKEMRKTTRRVENTMKMDREECMLLGGDFNGRIGERGVRNWEEEKGDGRRKTKDKVENAEGKRLIEWIEENGWEVLNGNKRGDEEGEVTYVGSRGETVIDYAIVNEAAWERVKEFKVGVRVDSDHLPLEITIEGTNQEEKEKGEMKEEKKVIVKVWSEQGVREYRRRLEEATFKEQEIEKMVTELKEVIEKATKKKEVIVRGAKGAGKKNGWWDRECEQAKREVVKALRGWRRNEIDRSRFLEAKRRYRERCREKKKQKREREEKEIKEIRTEREVWKYINRERKKKEPVSEKITIQEWEEYFMRLLEGRKEEGKVGTQRKEKQTVMEETEITAEEVGRHIRYLKKRKAPGWDGVQNEAWMYGTERMVERMVELMNGVWRGEGFPEDWREGVICPIFKKGEKNRAENYRGITLLNTGYKLYASVLSERMKREIEEKGVLPDSQAGFRKGRGTVDNVYILDHLARNELRKKGGRMYALFIDFKAAFDKVDRVKMFEYMRERGISEWLVRKVEEIYARTRNKVKVGEKEGEWFETTKGVRQGCPLSPLLFTIYVADVDEMLKKAQAGGVVVGREKVWSLAFADDMVIVAKSEREMKEMMRNLEKYVRKKKLEVNVEKTKMMVFSKRKRKNEESEWKWEESKIERVSEFKYLGYTFNERATVRAQVREVVRKANKVVGCVWGIGERMWGGEFGRRMMMFESMSTKERKMMARFRCGNEERENKYWMEEEERMCRMCREERETIEHMWRGCGEMREREEKERGEILNEDGREIGWLKEVWKRRERIEKERGGE
jgi:hypothetical protein